MVNAPSVSPVSPACCWSNRRSRRTRTAGLAGRSRRRAALRSAGRVPGRGSSATTSECVSRSPERRSLVPRNVIWTLEAVSRISGGLPTATPMSITTQVPYPARDVRRTAQIPPLGLAIALAALLVAFAALNKPNSSPGGISSPSSLNVGTYVPRDQYERDRALDANRQAQQERRQQLDGSARQFRDELHRQNDERLRQQEQNARDFFERSRP
jgi:hypothetical protein